MGAWTKRSEAGVATFPLLVVIVGALVAGVGFWKDLQPALIGGGALAVIGLLLMIRSGRRRSKPAPGEAQAQAKRRLRQLDQPGSATAAPSAEQTAIFAADSEPDAMSEATSSSVAEALARERRRKTGGEPPATSTSTGSDGIGRSRRASTPPAEPAPTEMTPTEMTPTEVTPTVDETPAANADPEPTSELAPNTPERKPIPTRRPRGGNRRRDDAPTDETPVDPGPGNRPTGSRRKDPYA